MLKNNYYNPPISSQVSGSVSEHKGVSEHNGKFEGGVMSDIIIQNYHELNKYFPHIGAQLKTDKKNQYIWHNFVAVRVHEYGVSERNGSI